MSLYTGTKKINRKDVLIGTTSDSNIYFSSEVEKSKRVKELQLVRNQGSEPEDIEPFPFINAKDQRYSAFISALSGSGKSVLCSKLINQIRKARGDPFKRVLIFTTSVINEDPAYESIENKAIVGFDDEIFQYFLDEGASCFHDKIICMDDYENVADPKLKKAVLHFLKDILERTRKQGVDIIVINHQTMNYAATKPIIYETENYYLNVQTNRNSSIKFLKSYMDLDKEDMEAIKNYEANSRFAWSMFRKSYPSYFINGNVVKLL